MSNSDKSGVIREQIETKYIILLCFMIVIVWYWNYLATHVSVGRKEIMAYKGIRYTLDDIYEYSYR